MMSSCALLEWRSQLRGISDVIRHNFEWNICDVMKQKDTKEIYSGVMLNSFRKNSDVLKNRLVSSYFSVWKFSFNEIPFSWGFWPKFDPIPLFSLTEIDLDIATTITGMMFHHRPIILHSASLYDSWSLWFRPASSSVATWRIGLPAEPAPNGEKKEQVVLIKSIV